MKLTKIEIKNFRLLTNVVLDIDNNMTLIVGKNNSGKTSFMNFLSLINENKIISFNDYPIIYRKELYNSIYSYLKSEITFEDMKKVIKTSSMTFYVNYKEDVSSDNFGFLSNFIIDIENTCFDTEAMLKRDCGIENIEKIVTKYSGSYSIKVDKEKYKATIILPLSTDISAIQY